MDEHTHGLKRLLSDEILEEMTTAGLYTLAAQCDVEPADASICDACAAYLIAQTKKLGATDRLAHEFVLGATDASAQHSGPNATMDPGTQIALINAERVQLAASRDEWMARAMVAEAAVAELVEERDALLLERTSLQGHLDNMQMTVGHLLANERPWLFQPGDRVLCLMPVQGGDKLVAGTVRKIQIPGPLRDEKTVYVELDEERLPVRLGWWDPDRVEPFRG